MTRKTPLEQELDALHNDLVRLHGLARAGLHLSESSVAKVLARHPGERAQACLQAWRVIARLGAPPSELLDAGLRALRADSRRERSIISALAGPRMATRILLMLPLVSTVIMSTLGFDCLGVLVGQPIGWVCGAVALVLVVIARVWSGRLLARARRAPVFPGFVLDLATVAVRSGAGITLVENLLARESWFADPQRGDERRHLIQCLEDGREWGIPLSGLLRSAAEGERQRWQTRSERMTAELAEQVLLPVGLCVLPAFILLVAVPAVVATLSGTALAVS